MTHALQPLRDRGFRLVTVATSISVLGDGLMRVGLPLQVLAISGDDPLAMSAVGVAWGIGHAISLPVGGVASDRMDRRSIMIASDLVRAVAIGAMGVLGLAGALRLPQTVALGFSFGLANGFFNPAARSLIPDIVDARALPQANALLGFARPMQLWIVGPLLGGFLVATGGPASALVVDGLTFLVSAVVLARLPYRGSASSTGHRGGVRDLGEGLRFVGSKRWAQVWFAATALSTLAFHGPFDVLIPTMLKTDLALSEAEAGWWMAMIFASGGVGALLAASTIGRRGLPRRFLLLLYVAESMTLFGLAAFAYVTRFWQVLVVGLMVFGATVMSEIIGDTNLQLHVPRPLLGRVVSLEWFVAIGLAPISFALAGPLGRVYGARAVLATVGVLAGSTVLAMAVVPGARSPERLGAAGLAEASERAHAPHGAAEVLADGRPPSIAGGSAATDQDGFHALGQ